MLCLGPNRALLHKHPVVQEDLVHHGYGRKLNGQRVTVEDQMKADLYWSHFILKNSKPYSMGEHPGFKAYLNQVSWGLYQPTTHVRVEHMVLVCTLTMFIFLLYRV